MVLVPRSIHVILLGCLACGRPTAPRFVVKDVRSKSERESARDGARERERESERERERERGRERGDRKCDK